jgi:hypothetical protein
MSYLIGLVVVGIAIVLGLLTIWGGIVFLVVAAIVAGVIFLFRAREATVEVADTEPTGTPRSSSGGAETANQRVGQT